MRSASAKNPGRDLELGWSTPPAWAEAVLRVPLELLSDHAYCEMGAAATAQGLIARAPERSLLVERLSALAVEELRHFGEVHRLLLELGGTLGPSRPNPYVDGLFRALRGRSVPRLLDRLLIGALIERRSLERFELLSEAATEPRLVELYGRLGPSERGHARLFVELAERVAPAADVARELAFWCAHEARVAAELPFAARIHGGAPAIGLQDASRTVETHSAVQA